MRDWLVEGRVRQKIEKPDRGEESRQENERQVGKEESEKRWGDLLRERRVRQERGRVRESDN